MKKILLVMAVAFFSLGAQGRTADNLRVYINPGHGSWTANDRPMPVKGHGSYSRFNTDTLSFFESNTNLRKGFGVLEKLRLYGLKYDPARNQTGERWQTGAARDLANNIVMSHVKCGPYHQDNGTPDQLGSSVPSDIAYYNRSLSEIAAEVDANNFDMFISIHSNAANATATWITTNYPLILFRGYDDCHGDTGLDADMSISSKEMAKAAWPYQYANIHEGWTRFSPTDMYIKGDITFYGKYNTGRGYKGYLGVLKHNVPGFLVEGYFHQYGPSALRHMNWDADYVEGYCYAHGIADYFGLHKETTGDIYGIVRDRYKKYSDNSYVPISTHDDVYMPLDNVDVTLLDANGEIADTYRTDEQFNGVFVFKNVAPGTYTLRFSADGYKNLDLGAVEVTAATVTYPRAFMEAESNTAMRREYAYDIEVTQNVSQYTVSFRSTGDAPRSEILLTDTQTGKETVVAGGEVKKGANSVIFDTADIQKADYKVAVCIVNKPIEAATEYFSDPNGAADCRGGVVSITDSEADSFGYTLVSTGKAKGVKVYAPDGTVSGPYLAGDSRLSSTDRSSMFRGDELRGCAVFADWSDAGAGYWMVDPLNPGEMSQLLAGTSDNTGAYTFNGTVIGGGSSCVAFQGKGESTRMYSFVEDYPSGNTPGEQNRVYAYDIGTDGQITRVPAQAYDNLTGGSILANRNVEIKALNDYIFIVSQCRASGNNTEACPSFVMVSNNGKELLNSSSLSYIKSSNSGVAVNTRGNLLAVGQYDRISIIAVTGTPNAPVLTHLYDIPTGDNTWGHLSFDPGDNLHAYLLEQQGYHCYSLPDDEPKTIVPAPAEYVIHGLGSSDNSIDAPVADRVEESSVYFNLTGVRVAPENLAPGVYIRVSGGKATKITVH